MLNDAPIFYGYTLLSILSYSSFPHSVRYYYSFCYTTDIIVYLMSIVSIRITSYPFQLFYIVGVLRTKQNEINQSSPLRAQFNYFI